MARMKNRGQPLNRDKIVLIQGLTAYLHILAGSTIEALLLWRLKQEDPKNLQNKAAINANQLDRMDLHHLIDVSKIMGIIKTETVTLALLAKGFRNLIHPGRSIRLGEKCNRGTAYTALAALEHVVNNLSP
jgi:hypothetical protein